MGLEGVLGKIMSCVALTKADTPVRHYGNGNRPYALKCLEPDLFFKPGRWSWLNGVRDPPHPRLSGEGRRAGRVVKIIQGESILCLVRKRQSERGFYEAAPQLRAYYSFRV